MKKTDTYEIFVIGREFQTSRGVGIEVSRGSKKEKGKSRGR